MAISRILVLGGYGNFGKRIVKSLSVINGVTILIAGRSITKAEELRHDLSSKNENVRLEAIVFDIYSPELLADLKSLSPDLVIHTGGPFQGQSYRVPKACIAIGSHYIDLADDRRFVCDIISLDQQARESNVLVVSGASSVPGLSSTVIDSFVAEFSSLDEIDFAIAPGNQAERGEATVRSILSYTGHRFQVFHKNAWVGQYGWMSPRRQCFGDVIGKRWLANIDIPDLELFPKRYKPVNTVHFQAGLELPFLHLGMVLMALLAKIGLVKDWSVFTRHICMCSELFSRLGTDVGGMQINLLGLDKSLKPKQIKWILVAKNGVGPFIPTISAIILAKKLINGSLDRIGATPCLGLYTLEEFDDEASALGIYHQTERSIG